MKFELFRTWWVELRTHSNPGSSTKTKLQTLLNPSKKSKLRTCSAGNRRIKPRLNSRKTEFQTLPNLGSPTKIELWAHPNPPKIPNFKPTIRVRPNTINDIYFWKKIISPSIYHLISRFLRQKITKIVQFGNEISLLFYSHQWTSFHRAFVMG